MSHEQLCPVCRASVADSERANIPDALIASGNVIFVAGIHYAAFEGLTRHVFSQMPSAFEKHSGACVLQYKSGGSHNFDFTLVVTGEGSEHSASVLRNLLSRVNNIVAFGPMSLEETHLLGGDSVALPRHVARISAVAIEDWAEYFEDAMKTALVSMTPGSRL